MDLRHGATMGGRKLATLDDIMALEEKLFGGGDSPEEGLPIYKLEVFSSRGNMFRNGVVDTWLEARIYRGARDVTELVIQQENLIFNWGRNSDNEAADLAWANGRLAYYKQHITASDIVLGGTCMFFCRLIDKETQTILLESN